ncbi:MAG: M14 family zinc carboxypeptidase, partial [Saprospiraceae bacterium]
MICTAFSRTIWLIILWCIVQIGVAQQPLKTPDEFLPHRFGAQFTPHYLLTDYFEYLAANAPKNMRLERYGATNEGRPLQIAFFSSPENLARLEQIRQEHLNAVGLGAGAPGAQPGIAIVWLSMSVHGNEPSGSECSMLLAWQMASQTDAGMQQWLKNTVVILDPSLNPDGYDRYTHWYRMASNQLANPDPNSREHREPWPGGRTNHYYFDLNRDWAWATQQETRLRLAVYHRWLPHVHADLHEQYIDAPYYFAPAAEPMHDFITPWQRHFQTEMGENHARYFDANGWLYFTKEVFDLFYPSYGDTYPLFNGAIGMTYEQAGHAMAGRAILTATGDTLTLNDRIQHHLSTSRSTIEMAGRNAKRLVENFQDYYRKSATQPQGEYKAYLIPNATNDLNKMNELCALLDRHGIRYGRAGAEGTSPKAFSYRTGEAVAAVYKPDDLIISAYQPHSAFLQVLFEPEGRLSDSLTYDVTAWAIPFSFGLDAYALRQKLEPKTPYKRREAPTIRLAASPYAWCVHRKSLADMRFVCALQQQGVRVRYAALAFSLADQQFDPGAWVINRADNADIASALDALVMAAADSNNV